MNDLPTKHFLPIDTTIHGADRNLPDEVLCMKPGQLKVIEGDLEFEVVFKEAEQEWVAKFNKAWPEAEEWAHHMADEYNDWRFRYLGG